MFSKAVFSSATLIAAVAAFPTISLNQLSTRATGGVVSGPPANPLSYGGSPSKGSGYTSYTGDGSTGAGWPSREQWMGFEDLWNNNLYYMQNTCAWNNYGDNNSPTELQEMHDAIQQVSGEAQVDPRFILAIILQESNGCVRVHTTGNINSNIFNPGLMQDHSGPNACNNADNTAQVSPCPQATILGMIRDGTSGTSEGDGLAQCINKGYSQWPESSNDIDSTQSFFRAARLYNSGQITDINNLNAAPAGTTSSYVADVANRLTGWLGN